MTKILIFLVAAIILGVAANQNGDFRAKRGASVYVTFPTNNAVRPHITKSPQDFISSIGANNPYYQNSGGGGGSGGQYQQGGSSGLGGAQPLYTASSRSGGGSGGGGSYGRKKRSPQINYDYNPYLTFLNTYQPSWLPSSSNSDSDSYQLPIFDRDDTSPYPLHLPNPIIVDGLLEAATSMNNAHSKVFKAFTARTPYFGLNGSYQHHDSLSAFPSTNVSSNESVIT